MARKTKADMARDQITVQRLAETICKSLDESGTAYAPITTIIERRAVALAVRYLGMTVTDFHANYVALGNRPKA